MSETAKIAATSATDPRIDESLDELREDADDAFDELEKLDDRTKGSWVECACTKANDISDNHSNYDIEYVFETFREDTTDERFEIPTVIEGSDIEQFLDDLGYSVRNAKMMEGDTFWMHGETKEIRKEVPSKSREWMREKKSRVIPPFKGKSVENNKWFIHIFASFIGPILVLCFPMGWHGDSIDYVAIGSTIAYICSIAVLLLH